MANEKVPSFQEIWCIDENKHNGTDGADNLNATIIVLYSVKLKVIKPSLQNNVDVVYTKEVASPCNF